MNGKQVQGYEEGGCMPASTSTMPATRPPAGYRYSRGHAHARTHARAHTQSLCQWPAVLNQDRMTWNL